MNKNPKSFKIVQVDSMKQIACLYNTNIVVSNGRDLILNSGGWYTAHTKKCMNIFLRPFNAYVFQKKGQWYVTFNNNDCTEETVLFQDNMKIRVGV